MPERLPSITAIIFGWYFVVLAIVFGLGLPIAFARWLLNKKKDYWPDTEDVLIGMGLVIVCLILWGLATLH
jgi:hypothetical protein